MSFNLIKREKKPPPIPKTKKRKVKHKEDAPYERIPGLLTSVGNSVNLLSEDKEWSFTTKNTEEAEWLGGVLMNRIHKVDYSDEDIYDFHPEITAPDTMDEARESKIMEEVCKTLKKPDENEEVKKGDYLGKRLNKDGYIIDLQGRLAWEHLFLSLIHI